MFSVIICTHNRDRFLKRALLSLARQTVPLERFEVIVVDDYSRDDTGAVCQEMKNSLINLQYIVLDSNVGAAQARNCGLEVARGEYILFIDDDCIPAQDWIEQMGGCLEQHDVIVGAVDSPLTDYLKLCHHISQCHAYMTKKTIGEMDSFTTANCGIRRLLLDKLGGFRPQFRIAQDMELALRARDEGHIIHFCSEAVVIHDPANITLKGMLKYSADHAAVTVLLRNQYRALLHTPFVLRSPVLLIALAPLIALKVTIGIYFRNILMAGLFRTAPVVYLLKLAWCWGAARGLYLQQRKYRSK